MALFLFRSTSCTNRPSGIHPLSAFPSAFFQRSPHATGFDDHSNDTCSVTPGNGKVDVEKDSSFMAKYDVAETNLAKGVAVCFLLWHHLFYEHPEFGSLVHQTSKQAKICVSMFVLLSGYGLMKSRALRGSGMFWRFAKLFVGYWTVLAVAVPVNCALGRGFAEVYPDGWFPGFLWQVSGLHCLMGVYPAVFGFNPTWWFMSLLIPLYTVFPLFARLGKHPGWLVGAAAGMSFWAGLPFGEYPLIFAEGILLADGGEFEWLADRDGKWKWALASASMTVAVWLVHRAAPWRNILLAPCLVAMVFLWHKAIGNHGKWLFGGLEILGRHCMDIFLVHTFFLIFLEKWLYGFGNPLVMFVVLLALSLGSAYVLNGLRWMLGVPKLLKWLREVCDAPRNVSDTPVPSEFKR